MLNVLKKLFPKLLLTSVLVLSLLPAAVKADANTLTVGSGNDAQYSSIVEAIAQAHDGDTLEIVSDLTETNSVTIAKKLIIIARGQIKLTITKGMQIAADSGALTLGNGSKENNLELDSFIYNYGILTVKDGLSVDKAIKNYNNSTYQGEGGTFLSSVEVSSKAAVAGTITGGTYQSSTGDSFDVYGTYDEIKGGIFISNTADRGAVYIQGTLNRISGGEFQATLSNALSVQHGGIVNKISGGTFKAKKYATIVFATGQQNANIRTISGGVFEADYALLLFKANDADVSIGEISGGTFSGAKSALQVDKNSKIDKISGGTFKSKVNGIVNVGTINSISGIEVEATSYGLLAYPQTTIDLIENSTFKAGKTAIFNKEGGAIKRIKNGVFYGAGAYAYENLSDTETIIEPDLTGSIGNGRYWGNADAIIGKVVYPEGFHMSARNVVLPVDGVQETGFRYLKKYFTLSYDANGGGGNGPQDQVEKSDEDVLTVADNPFTYAGKEFAGWNTKADGSGQTYQPADEITLSAAAEGENAPLGDTTLYAQWNPIKKVTVTFKNVEQVSTVEVEKGKSINGDNQIMPADPTKEDSVFKEWNTKEDGSGKAFTADTKVGEDITVYAIFISKPTTTTEATTGVTTKPITEVTAPTTALAQPSRDKVLLILPAVNFETTAVKVLPVAKTGEYGALAGSVAPIMFLLLAVGTALSKKNK